MFSSLGLGATGDVVSYSDDIQDPGLDVHPVFTRIDDSSTTTGATDRPLKPLPKWTYQRQTSYIDADLPFSEFGDYLISILEDDGETIDSVLRLEERGICRVL